MENLVNSLPRYLSQRCVDLNGSRLKKSDSSSKQSQQKQSDPNRKKRPYYRRGFLQLQQPTTTQQLQPKSQELQQQATTQQLQPKHQELQQPVTTQLQLKHQEPVLQQLQNRQQYLEQLNTPALLKPNSSSWPTAYDNVYEPQGPAAVPIFNSPVVEHYGKFIYNFCVYVKK